MYIHILYVYIFFVDQDHNILFTGLLQYDCETFWYRPGT